jgi:hypothetical protein
MRKLDVIVKDEGSIGLFTPVSDDAREWFKEHVQQDGQRWGQGGYVAEHRYAMDLLAGIRRRGLRVQVVA